ncbi:MAG: glycosyltransferase family 1 protein [Candidatus Velthaea sp.]
MKIPGAFVAGLHLRWDGVWQRPHHLLTRLARRVPVVVIEEPFGAEVDRDEVMRFGDLTVIRPLRRRGWSLPLVDDAAIATARAFVPAGPSGVWLYTPMMLELAGAFSAAPLVFDCMDELASFDFAPKGIAERDAALVARADVVFTGGRSLYEHRRAHGPKVHCYPSGVEFERFGADVAPHPLTAELRGPRFGYVGVIDERIDVRLIEALADAFPSGNIVMVGPVVKIDPRVLPRRPNVHFTGAVPYAGLPSFLAGVDVAIMPFARNRATENISPTKTLEYFAARRPVVTTPVADVLAAYGDIVFAGADPAAFVAAAHAALEAGDERIERGLTAARSQTWDAIADRMWVDIFG